VGAGADGVAAAFDPVAVSCAAVDGTAPVAGLGTGFTNIACQTYRTRKARKMARRTRRSMARLALSRSLAVCEVAPGRARRHRADDSAPGASPRASSRGGHHAA